MDLNFRGVGHCSSLNPANLAEFRQIGFGGVILAGGDGDTMKAVRASVSVLDAHIDFCLGSQIRESLLSSGQGILPCKLMGQAQGKWHELRGLITGETENGRLVARVNPLDFVLCEFVFVEAAPFIDRQFLEARQDAAGFRVLIC